MIQQRTIFNRPVFWLAVCPGCVRGLYPIREWSIFRCHFSSNLILCNMSIALEVKKSVENECVRGDNSLTKLGFKEI